MKGADLLVAALENEPAARLGLNLVVLVLQDNAFGMIRWKQGSRVESADGLAATLEAAFSGGGVHLVCVPVDYSENMRVLIDELRNQA